MKVLHQIGKKIHGFIHDMAATHESIFVESFDVIWERFWIDILFMFEDASRSEILVEKYIIMMLLRRQMMTIKG